MSLYDKIRGTIESLFQLGLGGPQLKATGGVIEARNAADSGYVVVRGADPVGDHDLVTKGYLATITRLVVVSEQFDGGDTLPANSSTEHYIVVTSTGANASIGDVLWDDGSNTGTVTRLVASEGRSIFTAQAFTGGTVSLAANSYYAWDTGSGGWLQAGASQAMSGAIRLIRYAITNAASQDSTAQIPANAVVLRVRVNVVTPYSAGATLSVGQPGSVALVQATTDNLATVAGIYEVPQETPWGGSAAVVRTTVGGSPAAGAGYVLVEYAVPDT